uniref:Uncharacterized protein n=1 Tax=Arundo donax TaxID=35708 RepID=A0A0A9BUM5_ARUDO
MRSKWMGVCKVAGPPPLVINSLKAI